MATSGTIGQTVISTDKVIEHSLRRAGVPPSKTTPEIVHIARECLYLLLMHYANTSLNLWCIEKHIISHEPGKREYALPVGSNDVLNVLHGTPRLAEETSLVGNLQTLEQVSDLVRVSLTFSTLPPTNFSLETSVDGLTYDQTLDIQLSEVPQAGTKYWFDLDPLVSAKFVRVSSGTVSGIESAVNVTEIPVSVLNRDQYAELPNKTQSSTTVVNYLFNKTLEPSVTLWPVPSDGSTHLIIWVHRQIQDVGGLTQTLAIPQRWFEPTIIQLSFRLAMELPDVDPARIKMLLDLSEKFKIEVTGGETDSSPMYVQPGISGYTR